LLEGAHVDIRIGVALPRTGPVAAIGQQITNGVDAAAKVLNENAPAGEKIVLDIKDDACDPKQAVSVANRFVTEGVKLVVGHVCSGASIVASDIYAENGILMTSPASNSAKFTDRGLAGIFRVYGRDDDQGRLDAEIIAKRYPGAKIAIVHDKSPFAKGLADATKGNLNKLGVQEAMYEAINPGERDYSALITKLKAANISLVYYGGHPQEMGQLLRAALDQDFKAQFFGASGIATSEVWAIAGQAAQGTLFTFTPDPRKRPEAASAVEALRAQNFEPEGFTLYGYAAVQFIGEAARRIHSGDPTNIEAELKSERFDSVLGKVGFDKKGDIDAPGYVLYIWKDGKFDTTN